MYTERAARLTGAVLWTSHPAGPGRVLPDGCMDLLWSEHQGALLVAGPDTRAHVTDGTPGAWAGVRFFPGTAPSLLGVPAHELRDRRLPLGDLWPTPLVRRLTAGVNAADDPATGLEELALRLARETGADTPDPLLRHLVTGLDAGRPVAAVADELGLTARQVHRRSLTAFGYGPKTLARVRRLQRALALARSGVPLATTAARAGYADQAHLARDVRDLTGLTPCRLLGRR
ncbi:helix-turn-helix transcriptional regulator [Streptomyces sp. NPDC005925]|uniref:helix-turn-helix transcriptional regulator n=1 Tax=Streptomyces sp. NPDC005925 TaxID=3157172 RepID=UPI0033E1670A